MTTAKQGFADHFSKVFKEYQETELKKAVVERQKEVCKQVWAGVITKTPVLTGLARGNWRASMSVIDPTTTPEVAGVLATGTPVTSAEESRLNAILSRLDALPLGQTVWLSNSLYYVKFLEGGTSQKAPAGMVAVTLAEIKAFINSRRY